MTAEAVNQATTETPPDAPPSDFEQATQHLTPFEPGHEFGNGGKREYPYTEAVALQKLCMKLARMPEVKASDLAQLARAWDVLEDRKRVLKGIPDPGSLRPDVPGKRGKILELAKASSFSEAVETPKTPQEPAKGKAT